MISPCWIIRLLVVFYLFWGWQSLKSGDFRGSRVETWPPLSWKQNKWKNPRESSLWTVLLPDALRTPRSVSVLIGSQRAVTVSSTLSIYPCISSQQLTPFIVSSSGSYSSNKELTGLHVHQIHKAHHGSTTEISQKSMKSFPGGFLKDLSSKTVFGTVLNQYGVSASCWKSLAQAFLENHTKKNIYRKWICGYPTYLKWTGYICTFLDIQMSAAIIPQLCLF